MTRSRDTADTQDNLGGAVAPFVAGKNVISNGAMEVCQRSTSQSFGNGGGTRYYSADRWFTEDYNWSAGSNLTVSNDTTVYPTGFSKSIKIATGATGLTISTGGSIYFRHFVEGTNIAPLYNQSAVTLSFWVRSSVTGTYSVYFENGNWSVGTSTRALILEYTITAANTWEKKTLTFNLATGTSAGTWNTSNGIGLGIQFNLGANADRVGNTYLNNWATYSTNYVQSSASTQWATNANATFYLTGVQLETANVATPFSRAGGSIGGELALCQRYYWRTANSAVNNASLGGTGFNYSTTNGAYWVNNPVPMRIPPTAIDAANLRVYDIVGAGVYTATATISADSTTINPVFVYTISGGTANRVTRVDANTTGGYLGFSAEL